MTEEQHHQVEEMRASIHAVLEAMANVSREEFLRSDDMQWRIMQAIVALGHGARALLWLVMLPNPWWRRIVRLAQGLRGGYTRLDPKYLWETIPRDWPALDADLEQLLRDDPEPLSHG